MSRFYIFPAVAGAAACLLMLKGVALLRDSEQPRAPAADERPSFARSIARVRERYLPLDPDITGSAPPKKKEEPKPAEPPPEPPAAGKPAPKLTFDSAQAPGSERAVLERLSERREEIEGRAREMDTREQLLRAAEKKLDSRVGDLRTLEEKLQANTDNREQSQATALKNLVTMYETMKPKEAARVFDRLDLKVLIPVVQKMNPRKMAEILAAMTPETAERLTVALATRGDAPLAAAAPVGNELPRLDGPARQPPQQPPPLRRQ